MSKPINRSEQRRRYFLCGLAIWILIVFLSLHLGKASIINPSGNLLIDGINHLLTHPFDIFPIQAKYLGSGFLIGALAPLIADSQYLQQKDLRAGTENGSAKWNTDLKGFLRRYARKPYAGSGSPNMILSKEIFLNMDTRKTQRNNNICCIGGAGTGKSRGLIKPNLLQANCSFVITDPSGELLASTGKYLEQQGYEIRVFNLSDMEHSDRYNPFAYIRNQEGVLKMISALIKNTTPKGSKTGDPFWEKAETALLQAISFYVLAELEPEEQNFSTVMRLLRLAEAEEGSPSVLDMMFEDLAARQPSHIAVTSYAVYKSAGGGKTAQSILISCQTRLASFNLDAIAALTNTDTINLQSVGDRKVALFCITPAADTTFNYLVALMYSQLFETLYYHAEVECQPKRLPVHVRFLLDEFANIGQIPDFPQLLSTMRKYEISCTIVLQALSQLKAMYRDEWDVLLANCDSFLFLGGSDMTTLEYVSKLLGKETIRSTNSSRSIGGKGSISRSFNRTGRELLTPDELRTMSNSDCIYLLRGLDPFYTKKYDYPNHPAYGQTFDASDAMLYDVRETKNTHEER